MSAAQPPNDLLCQLQSKTASEAEALLPEVYAELRATAAALLRRERRDHTLQPTALVHEAYLRLARNPPLEDDAIARQRFVELAARAMRRILVEYARRRRRDKRGGQLQRVALPDTLPIVAADPSQILDLEAALHALEQRSQRVARVAELKLFAGLTFDEMAGTLDTSPTSVKRDWKIAQALLSQALRTSPGGSTDA